MKELLNVLVIKNRALFSSLPAFMLLFFSPAIFAMNWPSEDAVMTQNFGYNENGNPVLGMVFESGSDVLAAEDGEVIFVRNKNDSSSRLPSPFGSWTAVDHGDGLISIYSRYERQSGADILIQGVKKSQSIASSGISGWSQQKGFHFTVYDRRERRWVNPAMIIMPLQSTDRIPQILSVDMKNAQGQQVQSEYIAQGRYTIYVNAAGFSSPITGVPDGNQARLAPRNMLAPQRIICSVNGVESGSLTFETFSARDGVLMLYRNSLIPARKIYANYPSFEIAEVFLSRGQINIEIIVQDISGNSRSLIIRYYVN